MTPIPNKDFLPVTNLIQYWLKYDHKASLCTPLLTYLTDFRSLYSFTIHSSKHLQVETLFTDVR
jgi:hypothetical protein